MEPTAAVLFDLDGTLVDGRYLHTVCWWQALAQYGHRVPMARVHAALGMSVEQLLDEVLGPGRRPGEDDPITAAHTALHAQYWPALRPFEAAGPLLRECAARGWQVVLLGPAAARELAVLRRALAADDLPVGDDLLVAAGPPGPERLRAALALVDAAAEHSVLVADTVWQVRAAERIGLPCIAVRTSGIADEELRVAGAVEVHQDLGALLAQLNDSLLARPRVFGKVPGR
ncbi:HAD family hydrolase [Kitasatospora kifunensis]|uniref:Beta-phosphoglucomutase-like phosphatase (HAD superfamily) n=1 Tax=Kitasatospora kifunensis TaxID=58351 RepID=A0A7W7VYN0_KITKI|nr:HAD family hydrolase [Kitasatospora kifunensis]MBB4927223.1 beta-phosphoglucomutase-like phosphatase (HAD superfamily) [Kitasatospora kifunensis]